MWRPLLIELRAIFRLTRVGLHLMWGMLTVACVYPWITRRLRLALKRRWSRQLLQTLGVRLYANRQPLTGLLAANHISFLDIFVINALQPAAFVAKDEVRHWPLLGWLCAQTETLFLTRGSRAAAAQARAAIVERLRAGHLVAIFPEGTTSEGQQVLPFHAALFQAAIDAERPVTPVRLRYTDASGQLSRAAAYVGEVTLLQCLWAIARTSGLTAHLEALPPQPVAGVERRPLAAKVHRLIASRLAPPAEDRAIETPVDLTDAPPSSDRPTDSPSRAPEASLPA